MGLITGIRIINLRVRDKVAYPDVTLDLADGSAAHLVVGLENGGGKSTLLGALYHVFAPEADEFLPRRSMRRQGKRGEVKRIEHYVPGGDPTHFIVEIEVPSSDGTLGLLTAPRLLLGVCLWKPAGAPPSAPAKEFFWSARSVNHELTLKAFSVRGASGRLLDNREFKAKLSKELRISVPAAQVNVEELQGAWEVHLQGLGVDVEFIRQFLLRMNEDEGAADQVFTYASSREFLESLVSVVGDPRAIAHVKKSLAELATDADGILVDRQRVKLLEALAAQTGSLVEHMRGLSSHHVSRERMIDHLIHVRNHVIRDLKVTREEAEKAKNRRASFDDSVTDARNAYNEANARFMLARVQVAESRHRLKASMTDLAELERQNARRDERIAHASALLADRRTAESRVFDVQELLRRTSIEAEPLRLASSSAVQALDRRLKSDRLKLENERLSLATEVDQAGKDLARANGEVSVAERKLAELDGERRVLSSERAELDRQMAAAKDVGLLPDLELDPKIEAGRTRMDAASESSAAGLHEQHRLRMVAELDRLTVRARELAEKITRATVEAEQAEEQLQAAVRRTEELTGAIEATGEVDIHPMVLDHHADAVAKRLKVIIEAARTKQALAAVRAASSERSATWLSEKERLPPRTDVERLCEQLLADGLGARPGWSYLSTLPADVASKYATAHPGLADGIVVNIPEDFEKVARAVVAASDELSGPIEIGMASVFSDARERDDRRTVVLPHVAYWSAASGRDLAVIRTAEASQRREEYDQEAYRGRVAVRLDEQLAAWVSDIGVGGVSRQEAAVAHMRGAINVMVDERLELDEVIRTRASDRDTAESARRAAEGRATAAAQRALQLDVLVGVKARLAAIDARVISMRDESVGATMRRGTALVDVESAAQRVSTAHAQIERLAQTGGELDARESEVAALAAIVVQSGDPISPVDEAADRELLTRQVHDRVNRWRGAVSDTELRAELQAGKSEIERIEAQLRRDFSGVVDLARTQIETDLTRPADHYRTTASSLRGRIETLSVRIGGLIKERDLCADELKNLRDEFTALRRNVQLASDEVAVDLDRAETVRNLLESARDAAMGVRNSAEAEQRAAEAAENCMNGRVDLLEQADKRLAAIARRLAVGTVLLPGIDIAGRMLEPERVSDSTPPEALARLLKISGRPLGDTEIGVLLDADRAAARGLLDELEGMIETLQQELATKEAQAVQRLDAAEALLRDAPEKVVRGDQMIHLLRAAPRQRLVELATTHHSDMVQRLSSTQHHVSKFHDRVDARAELIYATIAGLLREVRQTVRDSQLPNTPAMGRWAGADLLKFSGLDTLKVEEKRGAISVMLRGWFDPERPDARPRQFDSDAVINELLRAVTPHFAARILIPSDPLDPEHKPVEHLALETSGGEGVTVALIIASLLASRRALMRGHRRTSLVLDNPFAKVTKPEFLRLARDVASELGVQIVALTGIRDLGALMVFPRLIQLRVSRRETANFVVPNGISDDLLQPLLRAGTLYISPVEWRAGGIEEEPNVWPVVSAVSVTDNKGLVYGAGR